MSRITFLAIWFLVFAVPWENMLVLPGFGTISRLVGVLAVFFAAFCVIVQGRGRPFGRFLAVFGLFILWSILTYFWSVDIVSSLTAIITFFQLYVFVWLIWEFARSEKEQHQLLAAYVLGAYVSALAIIYSYFHGQQFSYFRYSAAGFDPNDVSLIMAIGVPMAWYLALTKGRGLMAWIYRLYLPTAFWAIVLTASRASFIAMNVGLLFVVLTYSKMSMRWKVLLWAVVSAAGIFVVDMVPASSWERISTIGSSISSGSMNGRTTIWKKGLLVFVHNPLFGVGIGGFNVAVEPYYGIPFSPHNFFLEILVGQGLIGLLLLGAIIYVSILDIRCLSYLKKRLWAILCCTWGIGVMTLGWENRKPTWFLFAMLACQAAQEREAKVAGEGPDLPVGDKPISDQEDVSLQTISNLG